MSSCRRTCLPRLVNRILSAGIAMLTLAGGLFLAPHAHAETVLSFCYDPYPPYALGEEGPTDDGLKVRVLEMVVARIDGVDAEVTLMPWARCQLEARSGNVDGILPLFRNAERAEYLSFTDGVFAERSMFWYSRDKFPDGIAWGGDFTDLAHLQLAMLRGSYVNEEMEQAFAEKRKIERGPDIPALMLMLVHNRADLIATDEFVGHYTVEQNGWQDRIVPLDRPIVGKYSYFGLSKASGADQYLAAFNQALSELAEAGEIDRLLDSVRVAN